jgi:hypothetical protein
MAETLTPSQAPEVKLTQKIFKPTRMYGGAPAAATIPS